MEIRKSKSEIQAQILLYSHFKSCRLLRLRINRNIISFTIIILTYRT